MKKAIFITIFLFVSVNSWGFDKETTDRVFDLIVFNTKIRKFCYLCGDKYWEEIKVKNFSILKQNEEFYPVVNGKPVFDIGNYYIYFHGTWTNLGFLIGFESESPEYLPDKIRVP